MSHVGKLLRGLGWYNFRNLNGNYHKDIADDFHKMEELNYYLDFVKKRNADEVHKLLEKYRLIDLSNPRNKEGMMNVIAEKLSKITETKSKGKK